MGCTTTDATASRAATVMRNPARPGHRPRGRAVVSGDDGAGELELSLAVEHEVSGQAQSLARQWKLRIERPSTSGACRAAVQSGGPDNRVVARTLENDWEQRLRELEQVRGDYEKPSASDTSSLPSRIANASGAGPRSSRVWHSRTTRQADRKAMLRLVIEAYRCAPSRFHSARRWCAWPGRAAPSPSCT